MVGVLYMESEDLVLVRDIRIVEWERSKAMSTGMEDTGMWSWTGKEAGTICWACAPWLAPVVTVSRC